MDGYEWVEGRDRFFSCTSSRELIGLGIQVYGRYNWMDHEPHAMVKIPMSMRGVTIATTWQGQPVPVRQQSALQVSVDAAGLHLCLDAPYYDDPAPQHPPGAVMGLWEYEVVEFFLLGEGGHYIELEIGPHGHHLALAFKGPRQVMTQLSEFSVHTAIDRNKGRWTAQAFLAASWLPAGPYRYNAYAIHGQEPRHYLACFPVPGDAPDFHRLEYFQPW